MTMIANQPINPKAQKDWHIHATLLPDGDRAQDWWIYDGVLHEQPIADAETLPGKYAIAGMVDAHTHLSMDFGLFGLPEASDAVIRANLAHKATHGVLAVRDVGALPGAKIDPATSSDVRVLTTGNLNAPTERFHPGIYTPVEADQLIDSALHDLARGSRWVKVIADFPGPDFNFFDPIVNYSFETLQQLCNAVHAKGARVAAHVSGSYVAEVVRAGIDSIEHGPMLTADVLAEMAWRGIAWTPTLTTVTRVCAMQVEMGVPYAASIKQYLAQLKHTLPLAEKLGVQILVGTDEYPDSYADEVQLLHKYGLSVKGALLSASDSARAYLGLPWLKEGEAADLVLFDEDPRDAQKVGTT